MAEEEKAVNEMESPILVSDFDSLVYMLSKVSVEHEVMENDHELNIEVISTDDDYSESIVFDFDPETGDLIEVW